MDSTQDTQSSVRNPARWNSVPVPERVAARAAANADPRHDGCLISRYSVSTHGYAQIGWGIPPEERVDGKKNNSVLAHRAAWVFKNGQVPVGMTIDHTCKEKRCVNTDHLRLLPNYENARRTRGRDWPIGYCVNGHDSSHLVKVTRAANASGFTMKCRICILASAKRWEERNPDKVRAAWRRSGAKKRKKANDA